MSHIYLSAAHKSSGKTTLSIGLCAALKEREGLIVQPFKKGPDYIDPLWLSAASGRACSNLDFYIEGREANLCRFQDQMVGADIGVIEGNLGLYDGVSLDGSDSNAAMAELLQAPVVLVLDTRGVTRGIAPLLQGYIGFSDRIQIAGVIFNQVGGSRHEEKLRQSVEHYTDLKVLGSVGKNPALEIDERHLGLMPSNEHQHARAIIDKIADVIGSSVDLDGIIEIAAHAPLFGNPPDSERDQISSTVRIGIPRDEAFGFYYADDLAALERAGAELCFFDALADERLPQVDGLFIGGGFPETRMEKLASNVSLQHEIVKFIENNGPVYAECGGLMYLCRSLTWAGKSCKMAGIIPADVVMYDRPQGRGYVRVAETSLHPWPEGDGQVSEIPAHEFHYSRLESLDDSVQFAYEVRRGHGVNGTHDGIVYKNLLASYTHLRDVEGNRWTRRFVEHVRRCKQRGEDVKGD